MANTGALFSWPPRTPNHDQLDRLWRKVGPAHSPPAKAATDIMACAPEDISSRPGPCSGLHHLVGNTVHPMSRRTSLTRKHQGDSSNGLAVAVAARTGQTSDAALYG